MGILECLKNQVQNHSKIDNYVKNKNYKPACLISLRLGREGEKNSRHHDTNNLIPTIKCYNKESVY